MPEVIYCDGVATQSFAGGVTKMTLSRYDTLKPGDDPTEIFVAQIIMPFDYFVMSMAFLEFRLKQMVEAGAVTQDAVDKARQYWVDNPAAGTKNAG